MNIKWLKIWIKPAIGSSVIYRAYIETHVFSFIAIDKLREDVWQINISDKQSSKGKV